MVLPARISMVMLPSLEESLFNLHITVHVWPEIPVTFTGNFLEENTAGKLQESIDNFLDLLVVSPNGSFKADYNFGFVFQNFRFENCDSNEQINSKKLYGVSVNKNNYAHDLKLAIEEYETRLKNVEVRMSYDAKVKKVSLDVTGKYEEDYVEKKYQKNISFLIW